MKRTKGWTLHFHTPYQRLDVICLASVTVVDSIISITNPSYLTKSETGVYREIRFVANVA